MCSGMASLTAEDIHALQASTGPTRIAGWMKRDQGIVREDGRIRFHKVFDVIRDQAASPGAGRLSVVRQEVLKRYTRLVPQPDPLGITFDRAPRITSWRFKGKGCCQDGTPLSWG